MPNRRPFAHWGQPPLAGRRELLGPSVVKALGKRQKVTLMPFRISVTLKDKTVKEDFRTYYGSLPMPREVITLEIDRHLLRVRVTEISGTASQDVPVHFEYCVLAMEL